MEETIRTPNKERDPRFGWREAFTNAELNRLHSEYFEHALSDDDWWARANAFSLGWICVRVSNDLAGFVNVAWDGGVHAFERWERVIL